jgi:hypothetical protein
LKYENENWDKVEMKVGQEIEERTCEIDREKGNPRK